MEAMVREAWKDEGRIPADLKDRIVLEHTTPISYIVSRIAVRLPSHVDLEDLYNTGVIGLMDAVDKYDPDKDCKFKTYAEFRIRGAILSGLRSGHDAARQNLPIVRKTLEPSARAEVRMVHDEASDRLVVRQGPSPDLPRPGIDERLGLLLEDLHEPPCTSPPSRAILRPPAQSSRLTPLPGPAKSD